jgi:hypothetical protein
MKKKKAAIRTLETNISKNKTFYRCNDKSYENKFINWYKPINDIKLIIRGGGDVNDIDQILDEVKRIKDELVRFGSRIIIWKLALQMRSCYWSLI